MFSSLSPMMFIRSLRFSFMTLISDILSLFSVSMILFVPFSFLLLPFLPIYGTPRFLSFARR